MRDSLKKNNRKHKKNIERKFIEWNLVKKLLKVKCNNLKQDKKEKNKKVN